MLEKYSIMLFNAFFSKSAFNAKFNAGIMCDTLLVMVENGIKIPVPRSRAVILVALRKVLKAVKDLWVPWVSEIDGSFFID